MRKVVVFNRITLDGFFAGPHGEIDWFIPDPELDQAVHETGAADTLLLGRVTYQLFESVWPRLGADPNAPPDAKRTAHELDVMTKVVFSRTLRRLTWKNSDLVPGSPAQEVTRRKQGDGSPILIFGSGMLIQSLANEGLIDEYVLAVTPVVLGAGKPLFAGVRKLDLTLVASRGFQSGNVLLHYRQGK